MTIVRGWARRAESVRSCALRARRRRAPASAARRGACTAPALQGSSACSEASATVETGRWQKQVRDAFERQRRHGRLQLLARLRPQMVAASVGLRRPATRWALSRGTSWPRASVLTADSQSAVQEAAVGAQAAKRRPAAPAGRADARRPPDLQAPCVGEPRLEREAAPGSGQSSRERARFKSLRKGAAVGFKEGLKRPMAGPGPRCLQKILSSARPQEAISTRKP